MIREGLGPSIRELAEQQRRFIEHDGPWNNGGKQAVFGRMDIQRTHDELAASMGNAYQQMLDAGFVMVPKKWRDEMLSKRTDK
jgi:hypothetical protein